MTAPPCKLKPASLLNRRGHRNGIVEYIVMSHTVAVLDRLGSRVGLAVGLGVFQTCATCISCAAHAVLTEKKESGITD